ncbi:hypothetical protein GU927_019285 [Rhodobacteraceae bacterium HSP-20]|uniref:Uncharacterized protein n=1 Tax=Paragemmobacter amnigenus TaxID=2852097 RepID=A0ABS6JC94_9RHOB|nr:hypothetical protein [Rhodobacter amnigenus]MBU9699990.1 hypothetical protein [Rhodobacter amnigenus]MBV4391217.1 hypothetical protein [Rhodobacter amnigenus]
MKKFAVGAFGFVLFLFFASIIVVLCLMLLETFLGPRMAPRFQSSVFYQGLLSGLGLATIGFSVYGARASIDVVLKRDRSESVWLANELRAIGKDLDFPSRLSLGLFVIWNPLLFSFLYYAEISLSGRYAQVNALEFLFMMCFPSIMVFLSLKIWRWVFRVEK